MKFWEAMKAVEEGKSVIREDLLPKDFLCPDNLKNSEYEMDFSCDWKVYHEGNALMSFVSARKLMEAGKRLKRQFWSHSIYSSVSGMIRISSPPFLQYPEYPLSFPDMDAHEWIEATE